MGYANRFLHFVRLRCFAFSFSFLSPVEPIFRHTELFFMIIMKTVHLDLVFSGSRLGNELRFHDLGNVVIKTTRTNGVLVYLFILALVP